MCVHTAGAKPRKAKIAVSTRPQTARKTNESRAQAVAERAGVVPGREGGRLADAPDDRDEEPPQPLPKRSLAQHGGAHAEEADAEGDLLVEAGAQRHHDAGEDRSRSAGAPGREPQRGRRRTRRRSG